jgi:MFS family permease
MFIFAHFGHHLMTALPGALLPFIRDDHSLSSKGLSNAEVAWVTTAFSLAYGIGQLPGGWLADRVGRKVMIAIGVFGVSVVGILIGLSTTYSLLLGLLVLMGFLGGGYHPASVPWISSSVDENKQGRAIGWHYAGGGVGLFISPFIAAFVAAAWGWHWSFIVMAIPCAIFGLVFFLILRRQKDSSQLKAVVDSNQKSTETTHDNWRALIALIALNFVITLLGSVTIFFSLYLVDQFGVAKDTAVYVVSISAFAGLWVGPVAGWLSDRIGRVPIIVGSALLGGVIIMAFHWVPYGAGLIILLLFWGFNIFLGGPVSEAFIMGHTSPRRRSLIYGIYYFLGGGNTLVAPATGLLIGVIGYQNSFLYAGIASIVVALICGSVLWGYRKPRPIAAT